MRPGRVRILEAQVDCFAGRRKGGDFGRIVGERGRVPFKVTLCVGVSGHTRFSAVRVAVGVGVLLCAETVLGYWGTGGWAAAQWGGSC